MVKSLNIRIFGKVQGVWFRQTTKDKAVDLGLKGVVMNEADGSVYISVKGDKEAMAHFLTYCKIGPPSSRVENIIVEECDLPDFKDFKILR